MSIATVKILGERVLIGDDTEGQLDNDTEPEDAANCMVDLSMASSKLKTSKKRKRKAVNSKPSKKLATTSQTDKATDITKCSSIAESEVLTQPRVWKKKRF